MATCGIFKVLVLTISKSEGGNFWFFNLTSCYASSRMKEHLGNELRGRIQRAHIGSLIFGKFPCVELFGLQSQLTQQSPRPEGILGQIELDIPIKLVNVLKNMNPQTLGGPRTLTT